MIKSDSRFIMLEKIPILNTFCSFILSIHQRLLENVSVSPEMLSSTTVLNLWVTFI